MCATSKVCDEVTALTHKQFSFILTQTLSQDGSHL